MFLKDTVDTFTEEECSIEHRIFIAWSMRLSIQSQAIRDERSNLVHRMIYHHQMHYGYMF